jgi:integrase/recombinase XerD
LFMNDPSLVRVTGPLFPFAAGFAAELQRQGYTPDSISKQLQLLAHLSRWLEAEGFGPGGLSCEVIERFFAARRTAGYAKLLSAEAASPLLAHLRGLGVAPPECAPPAPEGPVEELLCRYRCYLVAERGLKVSSASAYADAVRPVLCGYLTSEGLDLGQLDAGDVTALALARCSQGGSVKWAVTPLRSLLGFLYLEGMISGPLAGAVPSVASWRLAGLPKGLEPWQVRALLASCDRRAVQGCRDFAVLTMLVRLGLRRGEVANLVLEDVDWHAGEIVISGKGARSERLPLPADVGAAIAAYLRRGRPDTAQGRSVFVRVWAPHRALTSGAVGKIVVRASRRAGLAHVHAHRLRHTAATEMLRAGASLQEIGQVLRHRHAATTAIYAKVDREALRTIARPWLGGLA